MPNEADAMDDDELSTILWQERQLLEVRGDQVRIGVRADRSVPVHREEVYAAVVRANKAAASPGTGALSALGSLRPGGPGSPPPSPG